jgi:glycine/D-amino acid oxidase-like deaminating enzyme
MSAPRAMPASLSSLWHATAPASPPRAALSGAIQAQVAIIGAGYAGLSTALHLAEAGIDVAALDAADIGAGASGLNGGQVNPGIKDDPDEIEGIFGAQLGASIVSFVGSTADRVFALIERLGIVCDAARGGFVQPAHAVSALEGLQRRCEQWRSHGVPARVLDTAEMASLLGTARYRGGWLDPRGGTLHPLKFVRGLADAAEAAGARLFVRSPVERIERHGSGWRVVTPSGSVTTERVALMTNAYSDGVWPRLAESFVPVHSFQVATRPLPPAVAAAVIPAGYGASDTRRLLLYFRRDPEHRLLIGGRGTLFDPGGTSGFRHLERVLRLLFPQISDIPIEHRWYGRVAITRDSLPILHAPAPGVLALAGCNGRGVALFTALGEPLAHALMTGSTEALPFPLARELKMIPFHRLHRLYVAAASAYFRIRDWAA